MVKLVDPVRSSEARGKLGGICYNTHRGIHIARSIVTPITEYSDLQISTRLVSAGITAYWQAMTQPERDCWNKYATVHLLPDWTGQKKRLSGYNWFMKCNWLLRFRGWGWYLVPPSESSPAQPLGFSLSNIGSHIKLSWTSLGDPDATRYWNIIWRAGPYSSAFAPDYRLAAYLNMYLDDTASYYDPMPAAGFYTYFLQRWGRYTGLKSIMTRATIEATI